MIKKLILSLVLAISCNAYAETFKAGSKAVISGVVVTPTADASITSDEKPHKYWALQLFRPINVMGDPKSDLNSSFHLGIMLIQLAPSPEQFNYIKAHLGKKVTLSCKELFEADNGNHFTDVLCLM